MGCSTSSQTSAIDTTRPSAKPEESNGASTTGAANENGNVAEDCETIPVQAAPPSGEEAQPASVDTPAEEAIPDGAQAEADRTPSEPVGAPDQEMAQAAANESEPKTEEAPAPSD